MASRDRFRPLGAVLVLAALVVAGLLGTADAGTPTPTIQRKEVFVSQMVQQGHIAHLVATCPHSYVVTGGGLGPGVNTLVVADTKNPSTWEVVVANVSSLANATASADAFCIHGSRNLAIKASLSESARAQLIDQFVNAHKELSVSPGG